MKCRGGRRARHQKNIYRVTDMQRRKNRMKFGAPEEEVCEPVFLPDFSQYLIDERLWIVQIGYSGEGLGMMGQEDSGILRARVETRVCKEDDIKCWNVASSLPMPFFR